MQGAKRARQGARERRRDRGSEAAAASIPLAFFNFLEHNISLSDASIFAADYMGIRIDVQNEAEVQLFHAGMHATHISRRQHLPDAFWYPGD